MSNHEYFQELSALSAIGQLSSQEDRELAEHLRECASCTDAHLEYARVIQQQLPQADVIRWRMKSALPAPILDEEVRARFLARARADGIEFSPEAERSRSARDFSPWQLLRLRPALAITAVAAIVMLVLWVGQTYELVPRLTTVPVNARSTEAPDETEDLRRQLAALHRTTEGDATRIALMNKESADSKRSEQELRKQLDGAQKQVEQLSVMLQQTESEKEDLAKATQEDHATIADLRAQSDGLYHEQANMMSSRAALQEQVRSLTVSLQEKNADMERERQLAAMNSNVSQLMGARNLHIMDVHKVGENGKAAKAYGRVFYAEGQSLVFYAFDLPSGGLNPSKYTFEGWGRREPEPQSVRNLGTFQADDHEQHRWVLKVSDPAALAGIDSVFVTSESLRDPQKPRGKELMYADITGQPNRP
jgi:hypothetical protein